MDKTRVYLNRSKSSLINVSLNRYRRLPPSDPFLQIVPRAIGRLKFLSIKTVPDIPVLASTLFNGDLISLRELRLRSVRTELPWRNMINLTSFTLICTLPVEDSVGYFLDFLESAPRLREVQLHSVTPTSGAQNGRLVSLACLEKMDILGFKPTSLLLGHLLIPVGAKLRTRVDSSDPLIEDHLPGSLDNLRNLSGFTEIHLHITGYYPRVQFIGPNGEVTMVLGNPQAYTTHLVLESLARFDTSKAELLEIDRGYPSSRDLPYRALVLMKGLRSLTLSRRRSLHIFINALHPTTSSEDMVCPKLEELILVLRTGGEVVDIKDVIRMAVARASRGAELKSVRIISRDKAT